MHSVLLQGHPGRISSLVLNVGVWLLPFCAVLGSEEITCLCPNYSLVMPQATALWSCTGNAQCNWPLERQALPLPAVRHLLHRAIKAGVRAGSEGTTRALSSGFVKRCSCGQTIIFVDYCLSTKWWELWCCDLKICVSYKMCHVAFKTCGDMSNLAHILCVAKPLNQAQSQKSWMSLSYKRNLHHGSCIPVPIGI